MQELHAEAANLITSIDQHKLAVGSAKCSQVRKLDGLLTADRFERIEVLLGNREDHALLRFGDPDFTIRKTGVFERRPIEMHLGSQLFAHFAHRAGETPGATIVDRMKERAARCIARSKDRVEQFFFFDGVADLDRVGKFVGVGVGEFGTAERGAVQAIAPGAPAQCDDVIALVRIAGDFVDGHHADTATVDERVADVTIVEVDAS